MPAAARTATVDAESGGAPGNAEAKSRMAYAKTSLRGEQRALGLSRRQIAVEFARRYRLRPRAAWRHAHGWSLKEAAERISDYAARSGLGGSP